MKNLALLLKLGAVLFQYRQILLRGLVDDQKKEFRRFLNISMSSLFEIQTELEVSYNLKYLEKETFEKLYEDTREIERMMSSFISTL